MLELLSIGELRDSVDPDDAAPDAVIRHRKVARPRYSHWVGVPARGARILLRPMWRAAAGASSAVG
jgi:hypothetical protein